MSTAAARTLFVSLGCAAMLGCNRVDDLWAHAQASTADDDAAISAPPPPRGRSSHTHAPGQRGAHAAEPTQAALIGSLANDPEHAGGDASAANSASDDASVAVAAPVAPETADAGAPAAPVGPWMTALWIWVPIYEHMDARGQKIGYLRAGGRVRVAPNPEGTEGCAHGWYAVQGGGYLCFNRMLGLGDDDLGRRTPTQPDLGAPLPYAYMTTHRAAVMYRWLPSSADMREIEPERFGVTPPNAIASLDGGVAPSTSSTTVTATETPAVLSTTAPVTGVANAAGTPESATASDAGGPTRSALAAMVQNRAQAEDAGVRIEDLAGQAGSPLLRRMLSGMYISVDRAASSAGRSFWRTQNGGYVERAAVSNLHDPPTFQGVVLDEQHQLPMAFMTSYSGWTYAASPDARTVTRREQAPRLTAYFLTADPPVTIGRNQYYRTRDGMLLNGRQIRLVQTVAPPATIGANEKWVEVNLDRQTAIAYEGARPVYVTLVSTGRRNTADPTRNYETVQGEFRIQSKHIATTMDGNSAGDGPYSIEDVPWVMYFENSFALHGAFWHSGFGAMHSHGCVNMAPADARWMFQWTEPALPAGWHGVYTGPTRLGTRVFVHYERQALGERGGPTIVPRH